MSAAATTTVPSTATDPPSTTTEQESLYGPGGLIADLEGWADVELPQFITASHIDVVDLEYVSRFRSAAGHDYTASFEGPSSMKHYYRPVGYYEVRFTQPIYSPVDGVILYLSGGADEWKADYVESTGNEVPTDYRDLSVYIRPDDAPNVWIQHQHVNPLDEIVAVVPVANGQAMMLGVERPASPGYRVEAGDLIGYGLGEIAVTRHLDGSGVPSPCNSASAREQWGLMPGCADKRQFHSIFEFMTDEVFAQYEVLVDLTREDFIITAEERAANPLVVDGESFVDEGILEDPEAYVRLQEGPATVGLDQPEPEEPQAEVAEALPEFIDLAAGRPVIAEFGASGTHTLEAFEAAGQFLLVISADAGPIGLLLDEGEGPRQIYGGPPGSDISTYETGWMGGGIITITVEAPDGANWRLVAVSAP
jgi:hypothetical protein|tara:strand:- start:27 stop:1292 length:1266 start_codon:yes stop_codon:yes gene_type:complete